MRHAKIIIKPNITKRCQGCSIKLSNNDEIWKCQECKNFKFCQKCAPFSKGFADLLKSRMNTTRQSYNQLNRPANIIVPEDLNDDKDFNRIGDYYQCIVCDKYTVHFKNDKHCENEECPGNKSKNLINK